MVKEGVIMKLKTVLMIPVIVVLIPVAILTYYWWGYAYYRHVIN